MAEVKVMAHESTGISHTCVADWALFCYRIMFPTLPGERLAGSRAVTEQS